MSKKQYKIILASNSPRRRELLAGLDIDFTVRVLPDIDESYPNSIPTTDIAQFIAEKKADAYRADITEDELVITADTIVVCNNHVLGKPHNAEEARDMLLMLSGQTHDVITGVCLTTQDKKRAFSVTTQVTFDTLSDQQIDYYINHYKPFDKAGAYGIQEWIGFVGVSDLRGSYFNVMGLPVQRIYKELWNEFMA